jgi:hypothetical protein
MSVAGLKIREIVRDGFDHHGAAVALSLLLATAILAAQALAGPALAHNISGSNAQFVEAINGPAVGPFLYLGAKHMVTGIDHVLFLVGVVFYLYRLKDVAIFASLFTLGHSVTLLAGVLSDTQIDAHLVDAVIGFSVVYKAFENMGGFGPGRVVPFTIDPRIAVLAFGLAHGLGLATKLADLTISENGLLVNLISFNIGVELGQLVVLAVVVIFLNAWRAHPSFVRRAYIANVLLMTAGFVLAGQQIAGYLAE